MNKVTTASIANAFIRTLNEHCGDRPVGGMDIVRACLLVAGKATQQAGLGDTVLSNLALVYEAMGFNDDETEEEDEYEGEGEIN